MKWEGCKSPIYITSLYLTLLDYYIYGLSGTLTIGWHERLIGCSIVHKKVPKVSSFLELIEDSPSA